MVPGEKACFIVIFDETSPEVIEKQIKSHLSEDDVYRLSDNVLLVRGFYGSTKPVGEMLDIHEGANSGAVFRLNGSYSGYHFESLWEWMRENQ